MADKNLKKWASIEAEYRAGQMSIREIARRSGLAESSVRRKAAQEKWQRDLAPEIRKKVQANLVRDMVKNVSPKKMIKTLDPEEITDIAAARATTVVQDHIRMLSTARIAGDMLFGELMDKTPDMITGADGKERPAQRTLRDNAAILKSLTDSMAKNIVLERQAFNLDVPDTDRTQQAIQFVFNV